MSSSKLLGEDDEPTMRWELIEARPRRWEGPTFDAVVPGIALEHLELDFGDLKWDTNPNR